jgi:hypothetical protein
MGIFILLDHGPWSTSQSLIHIPLTTYPNESLALAWLNQPPTVAAPPNQPLEGFSSVGLALDIPLLNMADATLTPPISTLVRSEYSGSTNRVECH